MRRGKTQGLRFMMRSICAWLALAPFSGVEPALAQQRPDVKPPGRTTAAASPSKPGTEPTQLRAQLVQASSGYKSSLAQLLALYEADGKRAEEWLAKVKELYAQGLVTRREVETAEGAAARAREKVAEVVAQSKGADVEIAAALVEAEADEAAPKVRSRAVGGLLQTTAYIRYGGARPWSLAAAGAIEQFFRVRFGRALPIGAFGQSLLHDRWGYDHRNAMDVGLSPESVEGRALMEYLRATGVPFMAFRFAIPGKATGPHIHIGLPSHRIMPR